MKVLTISGTRPELIRLSRILWKMDMILDHVHCYTSQNFEANLSDIFFEDLEIRKPDYIIEPVPTKDFLSNGLKRISEIIEKEDPDKILVLGDTNSVLLAIHAAKKQIPVYHMEAGNRCYDTKVPEETNRRLIDSCSTYNLPYTENSKQNLINEGYDKNHVFKTGNPIKEVLKYYDQLIDKSDILERLGIMPYTWDGAVAVPYALLTFHRTENVDNRERAKNVISAINEIAEEMPVIFPCHPRTKDRFRDFGIELSRDILFADAMGFMDFVNLEKHARIILTDSGTVPEECYLMRKHCIVLRNTTERQELMENGSFILAGTRKENILTAFWAIQKLSTSWPELDDYERVNVSDTVISILLNGL